MGALFHPTYELRCHSAVVYTGVLPSCVMFVFAGCADACGVLFTCAGFLTSSCLVAHRRLIGVGAPLYLLHCVQMSAVVLVLCYARSVAHTEHVRIRLHL